MLAVAEHFYSVQGEGPTAGVPSVFLRLAGCNLMCGGRGTEKDKQLHDGATWRCDTIEVWRKGERFDCDSLLSLFEHQNYSYVLERGAHLVVTGGEPLLQQIMLTPFLSQLRLSIGHFFIEVETNGTVMPGTLLRSMVGRFNVSPKLANSGMPVDEREKEEAILAFVKINAAFKFVVSDETDFLEVHEMVARYNIKPRNVYLMPAADSRAQLIESSELVARTAINHGYNFSSRHQVMIWDKTTGV